MRCLQYNDNVSMYSTISVTAPFLHVFIDTLHWYYELLRLPVYLLASLSFTSCYAILSLLFLLFYMSFENIQALPGILGITVLSSPCSRTPVRLHTSCLLRCACAACYLMNGIGSYSSKISKLYHTARLLSALRLNLTLPLWLQGSR